MTELGRTRTATAVPVGRKTKQAQIFLNSIVLFLNKQTLSKITTMF